ncbi:transposase [Candidatus Curtissbacteria bacterium]|nr:transposase [Candidatus Curtissbacteria bacterium]
MPYRKIPLVPGEVYHVFNRSIAKQPIFLSQKDYQRALEVISFYRYPKPPLKFSKYKQLPAAQRAVFLENLARSYKPFLEIIAFCIMPNHVHFLLKALEEKSISNFMTNFQHSCSKYFNTKNERTGSLFQSMFKAVRIENDEQLLHVSRYIHLNPVSAFIIRIGDLDNYPWSSFRSYLNEGNVQSFVNTQVILNYFKSIQDYRKFVYDQAGYQQKLNIIKHLTLE